MSSFRNLLSRLDIHIDWPKAFQLKIIYTSLEVKTSFVHNRNTPEHKIIEGWEKARLFQMLGLPSVHCSITT